MNSRPRPATAASATRNVTPAASPRERPRRCSASTAGFSASARNRAISSQLSTCRATQSTYSTAPTASRIPSAAKTVRGRKCTMRSIPTEYREFRVCQRAPAAIARDMSLRTPLERDATLPDGRVVHVRVGVPVDSYIPARELDPVAAEIYDDGQHLAAVNTVLDRDQHS